MPRRWHNLCHRSRLPEPYNRIIRIAAQRPLPPSFKPLGIVGTIVRRTRVPTFSIVQYAQFLRVNTFGGGSYLTSCVDFHFCKSYSTKSSKTTSIFSEMFNSLIVLGFAIIGFIAALTLICDVFLEIAKGCAAHLLPLVMPDRTPLSDKYGKWAGQLRYY